MGHVGERLQSKAGQAGLDRGEAPDQLGMNCGQPEGCGSADVLAGEVHRTEVQLLDQLAQGLRRGGAGEFVGRVSGVPEPRQVDGDDAVLGREARDQLVERPPALREPVDEQHRGAVRPGADVVQVGVVEGGVVVGDLGDRGAGGGDGHARSLDETTWLSHRD